MFPWKKDIRKSFPQNSLFPTCTEIQFSYLLQLFQALRNVQGHIDQCSVSLILQNKRGTLRLQDFVELIKPETGINSNHERHTCNSLHLPNFKDYVEGDFLCSSRITSLKINLYSQHQPSKELEYAQYLKKLP